MKVTFNDSPIVIVYKYIYRPKNNYYYLSYYGNGIIGLVKQDGTQLRYFIPGELYSISISRIKNIKLLILALRPKFVILRTKSLIYLVFRIRLEAYLK